MTLTVHLVLVFHIFIAVAIMVMVCGHRGYGLWPSWLWFLSVMVCGRHATVFVVPIRLLISTVVICQLNV